MSDKVETVIVNGCKMYKCQKCPQVSKRRYNIERHYTRFHEEMMLLKTCCGITFYVKSDFYDHKVKIHYENQKYTRRQNQIVIEENATNNPNNNFNKNEISLRLVETPRSRTAALSENISNPKKYWLYNWEKYSSDQQIQNHRTPFTNIENVMSRKVRMKKKKTPKKFNKPSNFSSSKENVKIIPSKIKDTVKNMKTSKKEFLFY